MKYLLFTICLVGMFGIVNCANAITPVNYDEISHSTDNTWTDIDITAYLGDDAGSVAGVVLQVVNDEGATENQWGVRKNGSTDTERGVLEDNGHTWVAIGVDSNDIFEAYLEDASEMDIYILGYITDSDGTFFTNFTDKTLASDTTWTDIDISGDTTGDDVGEVAFFLVENTRTDNAVVEVYSFRKNGSTDSRLDADLFDDDFRGAMMAVDDSEILEGYATDVTYIKFYLVGYLKDNSTSFTNGIEYTTGSSYGTIPFNEDIVDSGNTGNATSSPSACGESLNDWTNCSNAFSSDDNQSTGIGNDDQDWYNFNIDVPDGVSITGIKFVIEGSNTSGTGDGSDTYVSWDGGTTWSDTFATTGYMISFPTSETERRVGGEYLDWGHTWKTSELTNDNFRFKIENRSFASTHSVDHIQVVVYYSDMGAFFQFYGNLEYSGAIATSEEDFPIVTVHDVFFDIPEQQYGWTWTDKDRNNRAKAENLSLDLYLWGYTQSIDATAPSTAEERYIRQPIFFN